LRHGDIHEHDVWMSALIFGDGGQSVTSFTRYVPAKAFNHAGQVLAGKDGVVHDQIADWLAILASFYRHELLHKASCCNYSIITAGVTAARKPFVLPVRAAPLPPPFSPFRVYCS